MFLFGYTLVLHSTTIFISARCHNHKKAITCVSTLCFVIYSELAIALVTEHYVFVFYQSISQQSSPRSSLEQSNQFAQPVAIVCKCFRCSGKIFKHEQKWYCGMYVILLWQYPLLRFPKHLLTNYASCMCVV